MNQDSRQDVKLSGNSRRRAQVTPVAKSQVSCDGFFWKSMIMIAKTLRAPACFKIRGMDAILARKGDWWLATAFASVNGDLMMTLFERGDEQVEAHAADHNYDDHWITPAEARELHESETSWFSCPPGQCPWDQWKKIAIEAGVEGELAELGLAVMCRACRHRWCEELREECGAGSTLSTGDMLSRALAQPDWIRSRWHWLMETDGLRVNP